MRLTQSFKCVLRIAGLALCAFLLTACALAPTVPAVQLPPRETLAAFSLDGRFSLRSEDNKSYSGRLNWKHDGRGDELLLSSPMGQGMAEIVSDENGARLTTSDGKAYSAADAEMLTLDVLGYPLPLRQLADWVRGQGGDSNDSSYDDLGRPLRLRFEQWRIDYGYDSDDPAAPPNRIFAERAGGLELRLRIDEWNRLPSGESNP